MKTRLTLMQWIKVYEQARLLKGVYNYSVDDSIRIITTSLLIKKNNER